MDFGEASGIQFGPASGSVDEDIPSDEDSEDWQHFNKKSKRGGPSSEQELVLFNRFFFFLHLSSYLGCVRA